MSRGGRIWRGKLAYLRSLHIELRERLKTQQEAAETAQAAQGRMDNRHEVALAAFKAQLEEHTATREAMKAELLKMGSAKRRALATDKALDADRLKMLQNVMEEDHAEMVKFTEAQGMSQRRRRMQSMRRRIRRSTRVPHRQRRRRHWQSRRRAQRRRRRRISLVVGRWVRGGMGAFVLPYGCGLGIYGCPICARILGG